MTDEGAEFLRRAEQDPQDPGEVLDSVDALAEEVDWDVQRMLEEDEDD